VRRALDILYRLALCASALCLVVIALMVGAQLAARLIDGSLGLLHLPRTDFVVLSLNEILGQKRTHALQQIETPLDELKPVSMASFPRDDGLEKSSVLAEENYSALRERQQAEGPALWVVLRYSFATLICWWPTKADREK